MAEALYIPRFTPPPPVNPRVNFWTALDWDPYEERVNNGVHIVRDGIKLVSISLTATT